MSAEIVCPYCGSMLENANLPTKEPLYVCANVECEESEDLVGTLAMWAHVISDYNCVRIFRGVKEDSRAMVSVWNSGGKCIGETTRVLVALAAHIQEQLKDF